LGREVADRRAVLGRDLLDFAREPGEGLRRGAELRDRRLARVERRAGLVADGSDAGEEITGELVAGAGERLERADRLEPSSTRRSIRSLCLATIAVVWRIDSRLSAIAWTFLSSTIRLNWSTSNTERSKSSGAFSIRVSMPEARDGISGMSLPCSAFRSGLSRVPPSSWMKAMPVMPCSLIWAKVSSLIGVVSSISSVTRMISMLSGSKRSSETRPTRMPR